MSKRAASTWRIPGLTVLQDESVPMTDGTRLATDIYLPDGGGSFPTLLMRTPYDKNEATEFNYAHAAWYAQQGFAVVFQDVRGRWASEGEFLPFANESSDGKDAIAWIARQSWSNGKVGTYGFSYPGATQMLAAAGAPQALHAMAPAMTGSSYCEGWTFRAGTFELAFILSWAAGLAFDQAVRAGDATAASELYRLAATPSSLYDILPLRSGLPARLMRYAPFLRDWMAHPRYDDYWRQFSPRESYRDYRVPGLHVAGWYDCFLTGTVENYLGLAAAGQAPQRLVIGPWYHVPWSQLVHQVDFGSEARNVIDEIQLGFFRRHLCKETSKDDDPPPVRVFVMGVDRWRDMDAWPSPQGRRRVLFLASGGRANSLNGNGTLAFEGPIADSPADAMASNPIVPVVSIGGRSCCVAAIAPMGAADQRPSEIRNDVLVYSSPVLDDDLLVIGEPTLRLHIATNTPGADVIARLTDVHPDGRSIAVSDGVYRLRPHGADKGQIAELALKMSPTAICFKAGHRIRLTIAGSDFPARDRNPNNGADGLDATWSDFRIATEVVFHDTGYPSRLELPVS